jgi:branched-chain amino acid transport system substrate-binding protein
MQRPVPRLSLAIVAIVAASCSRPGPIKLGLVTGLSGRHYDLGLSSRNGVELAVKELNAAGGVNGRRIELIVRDDAQDPETARQAVSELVAAGVVAIVGHATSSMAEATLPIVNRERVLMVSPTVSSSAFLRKDDWFVMIHPSTAESGRVLSEHIAKRGLARRVAVVYDVSNRAYSESWHDAFKAAFERAGGTIRSVPFTSGRVPSMAAVAAEALAGGTDGVAIVANALDTAALCQQVRLRSQAPIFGGEWGFTNDVLVNGGRAVEGASFVMKVDLTSTAPRYVAFTQAYLDRFGRPVDFAAVMSYEAVLILAEAFRRDASRQGVRQALLSIGTFEGLQGPIRLDEFGDTQRKHFVMTVRDGKVVHVD